MYIVTRMISNLWYFNLSSLAADKLFTPNKATQPGPQPTLRGSHHNLLAGPNIMLTSHSVKTHCQYNLYRHIYIYQRCRHVLHMYIYIYIHIHMYTHVYIQIHVYIHIILYICICFIQTFNVVPKPRRTRPKQRSPFTPSEALAP